MKTFKVEVVNALGDTLYATLQGYSKAQVRAEAEADGFQVVAITEI